MKLNETLEKLAETTIVTKRELVLGAAACALAGMVTGMLVTKVVTGWSINLCSGNGNGNDNRGLGMPPFPPKGHDCCGKRKHMKSKCGKSQDENESAKMKL